MKNEWLILPKSDINEKSMDENCKLSEIMNQIEDGRGWRFTDEQAKTLAKLVDGLYKQVKAYNKKRNQGRKQSKRFALKLPL